MKKHKKLIILTAICLAAALCAATPAGAFGAGWFTAKVGVDQGENIGFGAMPPAPPSFGAGSAFLYVSEVEIDLELQYNLHLLASSGEFELANNMLALFTTNGS